MFSDSGKILPTQPIIHRERRRRAIRAVFIAVGVLTLLGPTGVAADEPKMKELLGLSTTFHGVWMAHGMMMDGDFQDISPPEAVFRASATRIRFADGKVVKIENVLFIEMDGKPTIVARLENGNIFTIQDVSSSPYWLLVLYDGDADKELLRMLFTVS